MKTPLFIGAALAAFIGAAPAPAQQDFSKVEMKATRVSGNVHMLEGAGGNIGVSVGGDGILIVDDQFAPLADKIRAALQKLGTGKLRFVLNTHWHGDHTGGNAIFGKEAPIIAHHNVRKRLMAPNARPGGMPPPAAPKEALPVVTFEDSVTVHFNGEEIRLVHFPRSHTDGDSVILFTRSNVVHMGDTFFAGRFPFVDLSSGGDVAGLIRNVGELLKTLPADVKIIPGHGPLSTLDDLRRYHAMLVATTDHVRGRIRDGRTLEQIKAEGLPETWKEWGSGFIGADRWIETIHQSYSRPPADAKRSQASLKKGKPVGKPSKASIKKVSMKKASARKAGSQGHSHSH